MTLHVDPDDIWDPNTWDWSEREYRIWTPRLEYGFRVDYVDYIWATRWLWDIKFPKRKDHRKRMAYCYRNTGGGTREQGTRWNVSLYLHIEIMRRSGLLPPTPEHTLVDHIDGDTFNCQRFNLQWATYAMNRVRGNKR